MAAAPQPLDLNTLQPVGGTQLQKPTYSASIGTTGGTTAVTTGTTTERQQQSTSQISSAINMTPGSLAALESLIAQLSDRPAVSQAELDARFPIATAQYSPNGWIYQNPVTGMSMSQTEAQQFNIQQKAQQEKARAESGTIAGGTEAQKIQQGERQTEINRNREQQGQYSKTAALGDAQALIDKAIADALEVAMPQIVAASEGAGTSKSTFRANQTQKAAVKGGIEGAALGSQLGVAYGQIYNQLAGTLELLTRQDPNSPAALLLQALNISKGAVQSTATAGSTSSVGTKQINQTTQTGPQITTQAQENVYQGSQMTPLTPLLQTPNAAAPSPSAKPQYPTSGYAFAVGTDTPVNTFDSDAAYEALIEDE